MKTIINCETGEVTEREFTPEELAQEVIDAEAEAARKAERDAKVAQRKSLLERLGITEEEARLLLGGN